MNTHKNHKKVINEGLRIYSALSSAAEGLSIEEKLVAARLLLQSQANFFYTLVTYMDIRENKEIETAGINARGVMMYNPDFVNNLTIEATAGLLAHEALHDGFMHILRGENLPYTFIWNWAADLKVNSLILEMNIDLPSGGLIPVGYNHQYTFNFGISKGPLTIEDIQSKTAEAIYVEIYEHIKDLLSSTGDGNGDSGLSSGQKGIDEHDYTESGKMTEEEKARSITRKAGDVERARQLAVSRGQGHMPGSLAREIDNLLKPKIDWRLLLSKYITARIPYDYTFERPSRRSIASKTYLPSTLKEGIDVVVFVDTSGSCVNDVPEFVSEARGIANSFNGLNMHMVFCDADVHDVIQANDSDFETKFSQIDLSGGGGGTDHRPLNTWLQEHIPNAKAVVALTDGYTSFPQEEDVVGDWIWVIVPGGTTNIPFGKVIEM